MANLGDFTTGKMGTCPEQRKKEKEGPEIETGIIGGRTKNISNPKLDQNVTNTMVNLSVGGKERTLKEIWRTTIFRGRREKEDKKGVPRKTQKGQNPLNGYLREK